MRAVSLAGVIKDLVEDVFGADFVFKGVRIEATFHLGKGAVSPENEVENMAG